MHSACVNICILCILRRIHHPNLSTVLGVINMKEGVAILSPIIWGNNLHNILFVKEHKVNAVSVSSILLLICLFKCSS